MKKLAELYFQNTSKPAGQRFFGVVLMEDNGDNLAVLAKRAWQLGINPGGQILFFDVNSQNLQNFTEIHLDRLLNETECIALNLFSKKS